MQGKVLAIIKSEDFIQLIRYGLIGILGLVVDFGIYSTLTLMTEMRVELANLISSSCGLINNFLWNS
ncbi:MAG: GtrA family protein, partial [Lactobacillus sp.]|nr:GtrA family protein [Lactobacillus sp.]